MSNWYDWVMLVGILAVIVSCGIVIGWGAHGYYRKK